MTTETIDSITHQGTVRRVNPENGTITVALQKSVDECGNCPVSGLCEASRSETLTVKVANPRSFKTGDKMELTGTERMHPKTLKMATVIPCIALVAAMTGIYIATGDQFAAVTGGLGVMVFFFAMLYAFRNKIRHEFTFEVKKTD